MVLHVFFCDESQVLSGCFYLTNAMEKIYNKGDVQLIIVLREMRCIESDKAEK